nr:hypothetical protein [Tanacetum cinerariifolium]
MRLGGYATWDGGNSTWRGRVKGFGIVPVCVRAQEKLGKRGLFWREKELRCTVWVVIGGYATWDGGNSTWGGRVKGFGTVPVCVHAQEKLGKRGLFWRENELRARIAQSSALPPVVDEPASPVRDVSQGEAYPTDSGFIADQDRATIAKSSTLPHDSAPRAQEVEILKLKERVKVLEDREGIAATRSEDDAPIKRRSMDEREAATERIKMATVLTSIDVVIVLAGGIDDVPTGSGSIPTAGPPAADIPTGGEVHEEELQSMIDGLE